MTTIRTGAANCYAYWIEGADLVIGQKTNGDSIKQDRFIWLTNEGVTCGTDAATGVALTGIENCKTDTTIPCNTSKLGRLNIGSNSASICIPTITWKKRT